MICAVCCGTKRLVEIRCPADCGYLATARQHPPAVAQRQHERDVALLLPALSELTERQSRFFFLFQSIVVRHRADPLRPLVDSDVADATASVAGMLETASRGVIYEQTPGVLNAQELATALKQAFAEVTASMEGPRSPLERDAAKALRGIEDAAKRVGKIVADERRGYLELARRLLKPNRATEAADEKVHPPGGGLIIVP
jgi:hypothetical protein